MMTTGCPLFGGVEQSSHDRAKTSGLLSSSFDRVITSEQSKSLAQGTIRLCKRSVHESCCLVEIERADHRFHRSDGAGRHRQGAHANRQKGQRFDRSTGHLATHGKVHTCRSYLLNHTM